MRGILRRQWWVSQISHQRTWIAGTVASAQQAWPAGLHGPRCARWHFGQTGGQLYSIAFSPSWVEMPTCLDVLLNFAITAAPRSMPHWLATKSAEMITSASSSAKCSVVSRDPGQPCRSRSSFLMTLQTSPTSPASSFPRNERSGL